MESKHFHLKLKKSSRDKQGVTLRYAQKYKRVSVEGAQLVAIYKSNGKLHALNSSLISIPDNFSIEPQISKKSALNKAVKAIQLPQPSVGKGANDGLLIVADRIKKKLRLVWQFHLKEKGTLQSPSLIQIIASGDKTGKIYRHLKASHGASTKVNIKDHILDKVVVAKDNATVDPKKIHPDVEKAFTNIKQALGFYENILGRKSFDNKGTDINAIVRIDDVPTMAQNAAWISAWNVFVFGAGGGVLNNLPGSLDVIGHELTHGVITHSSDLLYRKESGALNEHFADVFGEMIEVFYKKNNGDFLIGESAMGPEAKAKGIKSLRNMKSPHEGLSQQPQDMSEYPEKFGSQCVPDKDNDNCGVHILSGILNRIAYDIISKIGFVKSHHLFYRVMTARLTNDATFLDYKNQMLDECKLYKAPTCDVVGKAFARAGL